MTELEFNEYGKLDKFAREIIAQEINFKKKEKSRKKKNIKQTIL